MLHVSDVFKITLDAQSEAKWSKKMDYTLAAPKLLCSQLNVARQTSSQRSLSFTLGGLLFQRAWLQGVLVSVPDDGLFILDDGTGVIGLCVSGERRQKQWKEGMYVMVVGAYLMRDGEPAWIKVQKMVDLTAFPDREAMWYLEVVEAYKMFYQPLLEFEE